MSVSCALWAEPLGRVPEQAAAPLDTINQIVPRYDVEVVLDGPIRVRRLLMLARRALLVGNNIYANFGSLGGCISDVEALAPLLSRHEGGDPNFSCASAYNIGGDELKKRVQSLLGPGADVALFYFAGHGADHEGDVSLCASDGTRTTPGLRMSELLGLVHQSPVTDVIILLDCCFSGDAGAIPQFGSGSAVLRSGISILGSSRGDQVSAEIDGRGLFTSLLQAALEGGAADVLGKVTVASVYAYLTELFSPWQQRPTFKANVDRPHDLRLCRPAVPTEMLRRLHRLFPTFDFEFRLDPSYEPDAEPRNPVHEADFALLQRCRAAKLVEPVGEEHMYFAAMRSKSCVLTPLGHHYWRMADLDLL